MPEVRQVSPSRSCVHRLLHKHLRVFRALGCFLACFSLSSTDTDLSSPHRSHNSCQKSDEVNDLQKITSPLNSSPLELNALFQQTSYAVYTGKIPPVSAKHSTSSALLLLTTATGWGLTLRHSLLWPQSIFLVIAFQNSFPSCWQSFIIPDVFIWIWLYF